jgi:PPOX class probable F420-dependent enzyme
MVDPVKVVKTNKLTQEDVAFLSEPHIAVLSTTDSNGDPHATPLWVETDGEALLLSTVAGRVKYRNIVNHPAIALTIVDEKDAYHWLSIRGNAEVIPGEPKEQLDRLAKKYLGVDSYPFPTDGQERVIIRVTVTARLGMG